MASAMGPRLIVHFGPRPPHCHSPPRKPDRWRDLTSCSGRRWPSARFLPRRSRLAVDHRRPAMPTTRAGSRGGDRPGGPPRPEERRDRAARHCRLVEQDQVPAAADQPQFRLGIRAAMYRAFRIGTTGSLVAVQDERGDAEATAGGGGRSSPRRSTTGACSPSGVGGCDRRWLSPALSRPRSRAVRPPAMIGTIQLGQPAVVVARRGHHQHGHERVRGQAGESGGGRSQDQAAYPRSRTKRNLLGDHPAERVAEQIDLLQPETTHERAHHASEPPGTQRQRRPPGLTGAGQVEGDHLAIAELGDERRPHLERCAEAVDQQQWLPEPRRTTRRGIERTRTICSWDPGPRAIGHPQRRGAPPAGPRTSAAHPARRWRPAPPPARPAGPGGCA